MNKLKLEPGHHLIYNKIQQGVKNILVFYLEFGTDSFQKNQGVQLLRFV